MKERGERREERKKKIIIPPFSYGAVIFDVIKVGLINEVKFSLPFFILKTKTQIDITNTNEPHKTWPIQYIHYPYTAFVVFRGFPQNASVW